MRSRRASFMPVVIEFTALALVGMMLIGTVCGIAHRINEGALDFLFEAPINKGDRS